jgi:ADP-heptose:LPS heptosyltransferase
MTPDTVEPAGEAKREPAGHASIAVFRALQLGDMLCAVPALRALRRGEPHARITLIGLPWAEQFAQRFAEYIDDFLPFPGAPGLAEQPADAARLAAFFEQCRARHFDLAIQLHGSGTHTNRIVAQLGAAQTAGFMPAPGDETAGGTAHPLDKTIPWPESVPEIIRYTRLTQALGYGDWGEHLVFPLTRLDHAACRALCEQYELPSQQFAVFHPGARMPSRRWPAQRFASVANWLSRRGIRIVVTGTASEATLADELARRLDVPCVNLCGRTSLGVMAALIGRSKVLVCNDTGVSHIAAALRTPSVVIACGSDVARWAPLDRERHHVLANYPPCRPCMFDVCPYQHACATAIEVRDVTHQLEQMLESEAYNAA